MRFLVNQNIATEEEAVALMMQVRDKVAVDVETVSLDNPLPLGIGVAISPDIGFYFFDLRDELAFSMVGSAPVTILHNAKFDIPILLKLGYGIGYYEDTKMIAYSAGILENSLHDLSGTILHRGCPSVTDQWRKPNQGNIAIDHVKMGGICIIHACNTFALEQKLPKTELYKTIDKPCVDLLMEMEGWGVLIDQFMLTKVEQSVINKTSPMEAELLAELGVENLFSNPQVVAALRDRGIIGTRKTKSAKDSVSSDSLKPLDLPVTNKLLKWRSLMKTLTTYVPAFRKVDDNGRLHTKFGYASTGRWTSKEPNHQNITRDEKFAEERDND